MNPQTTYDQVQDTAPFRIPEGKNIDQELGIQLAEYIQKLLNEGKEADSSLVQFTHIRDADHAEPVQGFRVRHYREREARQKAKAEIAKLHNVIRDEWPPDQAEEIINNCKQ